MPTRSELAKIHIAKRELRLNDRLYHKLLFILFGKESSKDLSSREVELLLTHFKGLGWKPRGPWERLPGNGEGRPPGRDVSSRSRTKGKKYDHLGNRPGMASPSQLRKIETLWMQGPQVRRKSLDSLRHFLSHYFHTADLRFVRADQVTPIITAIKKIAGFPNPRTKPVDRLTTEHTLFPLFPGGESPA